jgi:hypothetical protein
MLPIFFFPGRLDPVLDGGVGDEDEVVTPQMPTGGLIGQAVFDHQANRHALDAAGVQALGQGQVGEIDAETATAVGATMLGVGDHKIDRVARVGVAQVVQRARGDGVAAGAAATEPATARSVIAAATFDPRLGKIFDPGNAFSDSGDVFAWTSHNSPSLRNCPPIFILRMHPPVFDPPVMLKSQNF